MLADAPQTPAPVFAYRALRSIVFGEAGESDSELSGSEKENTQSSGPKTTNQAAQTARKSKTPREDRANHVTTKNTPTAALNSAAISRRAKAQVTHNMKQATAPMPSTPPRQPFRSQQSPAKSILKVSGPGGIGTPRRQGVSVSFTGVKRRASTESRGSSCAKEETPTKTKAQPRSGKEGETVKAIEMEAAREAKGGVKSGTTNVSAIVDEGYMASTEREMKRLVRRGQQAREYANDLQEKMSDLKQELAEVKRQNELLRRGVGGQVGIDKFGCKFASKANRREEADGLFDLSPSVRTRQCAPKVADESSKVRNDRRTAPNTKESHVAITARTPNPNFDISNPAAIADSVPTPLSQSASRSQRQQRTPLKPQQPSQRRQTILPPDRESAAQSRVRARREARKLVKQDRWMDGGGD